MAESRDGWQHRGGRGNVPRGGSGRGQGPGRGRGGGAEGGNRRGKKSRGKGKRGEGDDQSSQVPADVSQASAASGLAESSATMPVSEPKAGTISPAPLEITLRGDKYLPKRPGGGTLGDKMRILVNCWDLEVADTKVYRYDIQPDQLIAHTKRGGKVLKSGDKALYKYTKHVLDEMGDEIFSDGRRFVFSLVPLTSQFNINGANFLTLPESEGQGLKLKYTMKEVGTMSFSSIKAYLSNPASKTDDLPQDAINMLDNLIRWINRTRFDIFKSYLLEHKPEKSCRDFDVFHGYSISARPQWKLRINVDLTYKAFSSFPAGNLAEVLYSKYGNKLYNRSYKEDIEKEIYHLQVEADHYKDRISGKSYLKRLIVYGLSEQSADEFIIPGKSTTITQYFQDRYDIQLRYGDLPCVKVHELRDDFIPMELLDVPPFQKPREDDGTVAGVIVRMAAVKPDRRFGQIQSFIRQAITESGLAEKMGLKISSMNAVKVDARLLPQPTAEFRGTTMELGRGSWRAAPFLQPARNQVTYAIIDILPLRPNDYNKLRSGLESEGRKLGLPLLTNHRPLNKQPCQLSETFVQLRKEGVQLVVCILNRPDCYGEIKRVCELETFMITQCVKAETLGKPNPWGNILLKINGKLGGVNWLVKPPNQLANKWRDEVVMVVGADVTHPGRTGNNSLKKSVAAVVASMSSNYMEYMAVVRQQDYQLNSKTNTAREYIDEMEAMFKELLETFGRRNSRLPTKILFYRDGVSENQFGDVVEKELGAMQRACTAVRPDCEPGFTFIVVQKRHHIRFFPEKGSYNVPPGTVVDSEITHRREFDFFLCSQQGIQGTSKPPHFHIIYDDNNLGSDELQLFTYFLCHAYMRCTRSVSYPAPTYYSHLAAFRARDWLKGAPNPESFLRNNQFELLPEQRERMFFL